jgi:GNAT superfamily N-acetyltransferase
MLHSFALAVTSESILFRDHLTTARAPQDAAFRRANLDDAAEMARHELAPEAAWVVTVGGVVAAAGDILDHYNRPYGDVYMKVGEPFRKRGIGTYLVQELKRVCYESGSIPAARCSPRNVASRCSAQASFRAGTS